MELQTCCLNRYVTDYQDSVCVKALGDNPVLGNCSQFEKITDGVLEGNGFKYKE